jgi:hypothetical protein
MKMSASTNTMAPPLAAEVTRIRLIILRAMYAFIVVGLAVAIWPNYIAQLPEPLHSEGIVLTMLAAFSILCALGIRYPIQMIPILLWELLWKSMWLLLVALPRWIDGSMDSATNQTAINCLVGLALVPLALPWSYVVANYFRRRADRATSATQTKTTAATAV